jgi:hypothetical protein
MESQLYKFMETIKENNITDITNPDQMARIWENISNKNESSKRDYDILTKEDFVEKYFFPK